MRGRRARIRFLRRRWQIEAFLPRSLSASAQRADERTRTANLPITSDKWGLQGFARSCTSRISKRFSLLRVALCCTVLRSRWCQSGIRSSDSYTLTVGSTGLEPTPFGATIRRHPFPRVACCCRTGLSKRIPLLVVAHCSWVLRSEWCQKWCQYHHRVVVTRRALRGTRAALLSPSKLAVDVFSSSSPLTLL